MKAGWIGQMAGVGWGAPTEWTSLGAILPEEKVPAWQPERVNQFGQDDLYVEITFLRTLELYGLGVSARQAGLDFAGSGYELWHANRFGRRNLRRGIAPPDAGHPRFTGHADDIDYQIEADFSGLIAPGLPNTVIELGEKFGRLMNYGDGLYGGQFVGCMYAEAFFERDLTRIVEAGLRCLPPESQYAGMVRDLLQWHREDPEDWTRTWRRVEAPLPLGPGLHPRPLQPAGRRGRLQHRRQAQRRLHPHRPALRRRRSRAHHDPGPALRPGLGLQPLQRRRHPLHQPRARGRPGAL